MNDDESTTIESRHWMLSWQCSLLGVLEPLENRTLLAELDKLPPEALKRPETRFAPEIRKITATSQDTRRLAAEGFRWFAAAAAEEGTGLNACWRAAVLLDYPGPIEELREQVADGLVEVEQWVNGVKTADARSATEAPANPQWVCTVPNYSQILADLRDAKAAKITADPAAAAQPDTTQHDTKSDTPEKTEKKRRKLKMTAAAADCARRYRADNGQTPMNSVIDDYVAEHSGSAAYIMRVLNDHPDQWKDDTEAT